jgi:hypothetical protein
MTNENEFFLLDEEGNVTKNKFKVPNIEFEDLLEDVNENSENENINKKEKNLENDDVIDDTKLNRMKSSTKQYHKKLIQMEKNLYTDLDMFSKYENKSVNKLIEEAVEKLLTSNKNKKILKEIKKIRN